MSASFLSSAGIFLHLNSLKFLRISSDAAQTARSLVTSLSLLDMLRQKGETSTVEMCGDNDYALCRLSQKRVGALMYHKRTQLPGRSLGVARWNRTNGNPDLEGKWR
jgi:hypothetical protein